MILFIIACSWSLGGGVRTHGATSSRASSCPRSSWYSNQGYDPVPELQRNRHVGIISPRPKVVERNSFARSLLLSNSLINKFFGPYAIVVAKPRRSSSVTRRLEQSESCLRPFRPQRTIVLEPARCPFDNPGLGTRTLSAPIGGSTNLREGSLSPPRPL